MFELLTKRRFLPLFITQFFGAFNDNFLKNAILTIIIYKSPQLSSHDVTVYNNLAMALFMLPYFLFSALAGQLSDKFNKAPLCRWVKLWEIVLMCFAFFALLGARIGLLLFLLFLMGAQSTFFSPSKYSLLPQQLEDRELVAGNALIEGGCFLAILLGIISAGIVIMLPHGEFIGGALLLGFAAIGFLGSCFIPPAPPPAPELRIRPGFFRETFAILKSCFRHRTVKHTIFALSGFWLVGSLYISQLPSITKEVLRGDNIVFCFFLALFSIGVAAGSLLSSALLRGRISGRLAARAAAAMGLFTILVGLAGGGGGTATTGELRGLRACFEDGRFWFIALNLLAAAVAGGVFSIPLQALMQHAAPKRETARVIAGNNIMNALYMAGGAIVVAAAAKLFGIGLPAIMAAMAAISFGNAVYCRRKFNN